MSRFLFLLTNIKYMVRCRYHVMCNFFLLGAMMLSLPPSLLLTLAVYPAPAQFNDLVQIDPFPSILKYVGEAISMNCSFDSTDDPLKSIAWFISNRKLEHTNLSAVSIPSSSSSVAIIPRIPSSYNNSQVGCKVDTLSGVEINSSLTKIVLQGLLGPVSDVRIHFRKKFFFILWLPPFALITSDISYCLTALDRQYIPLVSRHCELDRPRYEFDRALFNKTLMVAISAANKLGPGSRTRYKFQAKSSGNLKNKDYFLKSKTFTDLFTTESIQYEGDLARFFCVSQLTPFLWMEWLLNGTLAQSTGYKFHITQESHESSSVLVISALATYSGLHIQCVVVHTLGYKSTTNTKVLLVQGLPNAVRDLELYAIDHLNIVIGWESPESVLTSISDHYCIYVNYGIGNEAKCQAKHNEFSLTANYELDYRIEVMAVNKLGAGVVSSLSILEPKVLDRCSAAATMDSSAITVQCSFNFSLLGYLVVLEHIDNGVYNEKYQLYKTTHHFQSVTMTRLGSGRHQVMVFPLMMATNLVGRRSSLIEDINLFEMAPQQQGPRHTSSRERRSHGGERRSHGGERRSHGGERRSHGGERRSHGGERRSHGGERRSHGGERRSHGGERRSHGGERRSHGGERRSHGGERRSDGGARAQLGYSGNAEMSSAITTSDSLSLPLYAYQIVIGSCGFLVGVVSGIFVGMLIMACMYKWFKKK